MKTERLIRWLRLQIVKERGMAALSRGYNFTYTEHSHQERAFAFEEVMSLLANPRKPKKAPKK